MHRLTDTDLGFPVPEPQLDTFVFCKTKEDIGAFLMDDIGNETVDLLANDLYVFRYKSIKGLVEGGQIDLVLHLHDLGTAASCLCLLCRNCCILPEIIVMNYGCTCFSIPLSSISTASSRLE